MIDKLKLESYDVVEYNINFNAEGPLEKHRNQWTKVSVFFHCLSWT